MGVDRIQRVVGRLGVAAWVATATGWGRLMRDLVPREFIGEAPPLSMTNWPLADKYSGALSTRKTREHDPVRN